MKQSVKMVDERDFALYAGEMAAVLEKDTVRESDGSVTFRQASEEDCERLIRLWLTASGEDASNYEF